MRERFLMSSRWAASVGCFLSACIGMIGCANHAPATAPAASATAAPPSPVIVRLLGRNYSVVISAGPKSPVYTIRNATGAVVARDVTLNELRDSRVDLYDQLAPLISPTNSAMATSLRAD